MSDLPRKRVEIGGAVFYIAKFPPMDGLEVLGDLQQSFLSPVLAAAAARGEAANSTDPAVKAAAQRKAMMAAAGQISDKMNGKQLRAIAMQLIVPDLISVEIGGAPPRRLDTAAQGLAFKSTADLVELCMAVVVENFSDFLARFGGAFGAGSAPKDGPPPEN